MIDSTFRAAPGRALAGARPGVWLAFAFLALIVVASAAPGLLAHGSPDAADPLRTLQPPGAGHPLGTDQNGRDLYVRIVYGTRDSVLTGLGATVLALGAGVLVGGLSALGGRAADAVLMRAVDALLAIPGLVMALLMITALGGGTVNSMIAIAVIAAPGYARLVRAQLLVVRRSGYAEAAVALGRPPVLIAVRHLLPNALPPVLLLATLGSGAAIGATAALSYLGLGPAPPAPQWGAMLQQGQEYFSLAWWTAVAPGAVLTLTVLSLTVVGQYLQKLPAGRLER
ncbi:ABC transporter permease [Actinocorallia aurantiaca]|uniref:ABC transporter permease n=1 Tax=Actinocorallia aurantiaca TaxID=46204 RepID=A0ABP6GQE4_9ACTN